MSPNACILSLRSIHPLLEGAELEIRTMALKKSFIVSLYPILRLLIPFFLIIPLRGQFSPGELSKYHEDLEGTLNCIKCHELRKKELSDGCIICHSPLKNRIDAGTGFHKDNMPEQEGAA